MVTVVWPLGFKVPHVMVDSGVVKPALLKRDTPTALMGEIDPVVDKVWLVVRRPAVSAVSSMPVMAIAITAPDPSFLNVIYLPPNKWFLKSYVLINIM